MTLGGPPDSGEAGKKCVTPEIWNSSNTLQNMYRYSILKICGAARTKISFQLFAETINFDQRKLLVHISITVPFAYMDEIYPQSKEV